MNPLLRQLGIDLPIAQVRTVAAPDPSRNPSVWVAYRRRRPMYPLELT